MVGLLTNQADEAFVGPTFCTSTSPTFNSPSASSSPRRTQYKLPTLGLPSMRRGCSRAHFSRSSSSLVFSRWPLLNSSCETVLTCRGSLRGASELVEAAAARAGCSGSDAETPPDSIGGSESQSQVPVNLRAGPGKVKAGASSHLTASGHASCPKNPEGGARMAPCQEEAAQRSSASSEEERGAGAGHRR